MHRGAVARVSVAQRPWVAFGAHETVSVAHEKSVLASGSFCEVLWRSYKFLLLLLFFRVVRVKEDSFA